MEPGSLVAGKYRVERVLGEGGMGRVLEATHVELDQKVAIKYLRAEAMTRPEAVPRFLREARASVRLKSEHVARVTDVGTTEDGTPFMVMELLEGKDLALLIRDSGPVPSVTAVNYTLQACQAVAEAHGLGITHRDLKPGNLFLTSSAHGTDLVKVLDFGISKARAQAEEEFSITKSTALVGSPGYMAPEQLRAPRDADAKSDVWSLGVVLYELLEGRVPFQAESFSELCLKVAMDPAPPMTRAPAGLAQVVLRCLEKDPARRFATVAALANALVPFGPPQSAEAAARVGRLLIGRSRAFTAPPEPEVVADNNNTLERASGVIPWKEHVKSRWALGVAALVTIGAGLTVGLFLARTPPPAIPDAEASATVAIRPPAPAAAVVEPVVAAPSVPDAAPPPPAAEPDAAPPASPPPVRRRKVEKPEEPDVYESRK